MKTTLFAALAACTLLGCGQGQPSDARSPQLVDQAQRSADAWAKSAYAIYGEAAVETCLAAFHAARQSAASAQVDPGTHQGLISYREQLADFMCACARGQSIEACPVP